MYTISNFVKDLIEGNSEEIDKLLKILSEEYNIKPNKKSIKSILYERNGPNDRGLC